MMMLSKDRAFVSHYEAEVNDLPSAGVDFAFTDGHASARARSVSVVPWEGEPWTGEFAVSEPVSRRAVSGLFSTPDPVGLCVVERGTAFLVDVLSPAECQVVPTSGPVVAVDAAVDAALLLLVTPWSITAIGPEGVAWTSPRIAIESVRVDEVENGWLRGVADPDEDEPRDFAIDLATGELVGGAGIE